MDAYFDMFSGISGNMVLGALLDLGLDLNELNQELDKLGLSEEYKINVKKLKKEGIGGTYIDVEQLKHHHKHDHNHYNDNHNHNHNHKDGHYHEHKEEQQAEHCHTEHKHKEGNGGDKDHSHEKAHDHQHGRNLSDINNIIDSSELSDRVKGRSKEIFLNLARAEARIHGTAIDEIHFHEVGAVDAIVDIVGTVIGLELLNIDRIYASRVHIGTGFVDCAHGKMPLPAPATMELLAGVPIYSTGIESELVTPTGAAIITTLAETFGDRPKMKIEKTGYGAGSRDLEIPNLLRINTGHIKNTEQTEVKKNIKKGSITILETNIDDMNPEFYEYIMEKLLAAGALDVYFTPIQMKKNRPAVKLNILIEGNSSDILHEVQEIIFTETSSLGIRVLDNIKRYCLDRKIEKINSPWGTVRVRVGYLGDRAVNIAPEYEDCKEIAANHDIPLKIVYDQIKKLINDNTKYMHVSNEE